MEEHTGSENERIKHLEFIQATIARLGNNSFLIRGWTVTVTGALIAVSVQVNEWRIAAVALLIGFAFWILDASYLRRERMFRLLYDEAALRNPPRVPLFSMDINPYMATIGWRKVITSSSIVMIYLPVLMLDLAVACVLGT
ncbi:hypothetical protein SAMN05428941_3335 [Streptomyces sp. 2114.2]|nr:hypothetical protein BX268_3345 [Streptomyces sp. 2221.1]SDT53909.1 hypothetical protein SAMN05428941_3335 [Streptomyces sp. 2114.2]